MVHVRVLFVVYCQGTSNNTAIKMVNLSTLRILQIQNEIPVLMSSTTPSNAFGDAPPGFWYMYDHEI